MSSEAYNREASAIIQSWIDRIKLADNDHTEVSLADLEDLVGKVSFVETAADTYWESSTTQCW